MEVKEVFKLEDPNNPGRRLVMHLSEDEVVKVMEAGLFHLLRSGFIAISAMPDDDIELPPDATAQ